MRLLHAILVFSFAPLFAGAQATTLEEPSAPSLLDMFVRKWSAELSLGDLRTLAMPDSAIELRFWEGFGLAGVRALVLKRNVSGQWSAQRVVIEGRYTIQADTLSLPPPSSIYHPERVWPTLIAMGLFTLPTKVPRTWMMLDGHTYVLEVRRGQVYRASEIEDLEKPEVPADATIRRIAMMLRRYLER